MYYWFGFTWFWPFWVNLVFHSFKILYQINLLGYNLFIFFFFFFFLWIYFALVPIFVCLVLLGSIWSPLVDLFRFGFKVMYNILYLLSFGWSVLMDLFCLGSYIVPITVTSPTFNILLDPCCCGLSPKGYVLHGNQFFVAILGLFSLSLSLSLFFCFFFLSFFFFFFFCNDDF